MKFCQLFTGLLNTGKDCWSRCGSHQGDCEWCGAVGLCCRKGWTPGNGCDGLIGGHTMHQCVAKTGKKFFYICVFMYHVLSLSFLSIDGIPGDRIPLLWVKNNGDFSIQTSADANHEKLFAFTESKKHHISIQQVPEDDNAIITIEVDGEVISTVVNNNPQTY